MAEHPEGQPRLQRLEVFRDDVNVDRLAVELLDEVVVVGAGQVERGVEDLRAAVRGVLRGQCVDDGAGCLIGAAQPDDDEDVGLFANFRRQRFDPAAKVCVRTFVDVDPAEHIAFVGVAIDDGQCVGVPGRICVIFLLRQVRLGVGSVEFHVDHLSM